MGSMAAGCHVVLTTGDKGYCLCPSAYLLLAVAGTSTESGLRALAAFWSS